MIYRQYVRSEIINIKIAKITRIRVMGLGDNEYLISTVIISSFECHFNLLTSLCFCSSTRGAWGVVD